MYFTICIPVYNRAYTILRTLESVKKQAFDSYEVLIVDDGSTDNTRETVLQYITENDVGRKFQYLYKENGGKHSALNLGIKMANGEFFIILDSDDWLAEGTLQRLYMNCQKIEKDESFCGVMGKSVNSKDGKVIGDQFDLQDPVSSYFDYHFIMPQKMFVNDCFEANKTKILKKYRFPEEPGMRFVPEAWMFDQIGVQYKLLLTNEVYKYVEYLDDGITNDSDFKRKNARGFLYHYISRIENVLPKKKLSFKLSLKLQIGSWYRYWQCVKFDVQNQGPRIKRITLIGYTTKIMYPLISCILSNSLKENSK